MHKNIRRILIPTICLSAAAAVVLVILRNTPAAPKQPLSSSGSAAGKPCRPCRLRYKKMRSSLRTRIPRGI